MLWLCFVWELILNPTPFVATIVGPFKDVLKPIGSDPSTAGPFARRMIYMLRRTGRARIVYDDGKVENRIDQCVPNTVAVAALNRRRAGIRVGRIVNNNIISIHRGRFH